MEKGIPRYQLVYHHMVWQIYAGRLRPGDKLDSMQKLCDCYAVGKNTVRAALRLLEENGFVHTAQGKRPTVAVQLFQEPATAGWRKERVADACRIQRVFLPPLVCNGLARCGAEEFETLRLLLDDLDRSQGDPGAFHQIEGRFFHTILFQTKNVKILELYYRIEDSLIRRKLAASREEGRARAFREEYALRLRSLLRLAEEDRPVLEPVRSLYRWLETGLAEPGRPEPAPAGEGHEKTGCLYDQIVSSVIDGVLTGAYAGGDYLPSEREMRQARGVSVNTVRAAYRALNEMGLTETVNGKGTWVRPFCGATPRDDYHGLESLKGISSFYESARLIALTAEEVARAAAARVSARDIDRMQERLRAARARGFEAVCVVLLEELTGAVIGGALQDFYREVKKDLIWSVRLRAGCDGALLRGEEQIAGADCERAVALLKGGDAAGFSAVCAGIFNRALEISGVLIRNKGIFLPAESRPGEEP